MDAEVLMPPIEEFGPKMRALRTDQMRRFVWLMALGERNAAKAAREAGYSDASKAAKVSAHYLMHNQAVLDAIEECGRLALRGLAPLAIGAARFILSRPKHPAHARMIETVLDRTGFGAKTEVDVSVKHSVDFREVEALARRLAAESGVPVARLLGPNVIEGEVVDERDGTDRAEGDRAAGRDGSGAGGVGRDGAGLPDDGDRPVDAGTLRGGGGGGSDCVGDRGGGR